MTLDQSWYATDTRDWTCEAPDGAAAAFHRGLPGYAPTPLVEAPALAAELGVGRLFVKDESARFDLGAFKYLGASWAGFRAVAARTGYPGRRRSTGSARIWHWPPPPAPTAGPVRPAVAPARPAAASAR